MRQGEQFGLQWSWIDFDHKLITIPRSKSGRPIYIDLIDEAVEILRSFATWQFSKWIFPHPRDPSRPLSGRTFYQRIFKPRLARAGLKVGRPDGIVWHTLRDTFGTRLGLSGATDMEFLAAGRWKSTEMIRRYTHVNREHVRPRLEKLSQFPPQPPLDKAPSEADAPTDTQK